ncbi:hypothetical protein ABFS82_04G205700 [Erythranthe guttata]
MKQKFNNSVQLVLIFLVLLTIAASVTSARNLSPKLIGEEPNLDINNGISSKKSVAGEMDSTKDSFSKVMGVEECEEEDEDCLERRVIAEVHLDYIYTQQHQP